jgi:pyruvate, water dikinase
MVANLATSGVKVPPGFATTAEAYWHFVESNGLKATISSVMSELESGKTSLPDAGQTIRRAFLRGEWPKETGDAILVA